MRLKRRGLGAAVALAIGSAPAAGAVVIDGGGAFAAPQPTVMPSAVTPTSVTPISAAGAALPDVPPPSAFVAAVPDPPARRPAHPPATVGPGTVPLLVLGALSIALVIFVRRRHRRRVGWGFMPDRSLPRSRR